jgi:glycine/D-amino acid oxidase-like deaminating enzyme
MLDLSQEELRSSHTPWKTSAPRRHGMAQGNFRCEVLVVGAGITGALVAERLTREGRDVVIVDREDPTQGSTLASTAMLLWEIDRPLGQLVALYGYERAVRAYQASLAAARGLTDLVSRCGVACELVRRDALYLAADERAGDLAAEAALRNRAGLPSLFLDHARLRERFGIARAAAILSGDAAEADPVALAAGLLDVALKRGARLRKGEATVFDDRLAKVTVGFDDGSEAEAQHVVLATGYVMPAIVRARVQRVSSSWAVATAPQPQNLWPERALIWEASEDYHYARTTTDGRIIFGGEDDRTLVKPRERDAATPAKARVLAERLKALWPRADTRIDYQWSGTFDTTEDGLPLIGPIDGAARLCAAYGYGGNGITFSYLAAHLIATWIAGGTSKLFDDFAIGRDAAKNGHEDSRVPALTDAPWNAIHGLKREQTG